MKRTCYKFIFSLLFFPSFSWAGAVITYHGRILDKSNRPLEAFNVTFRIRIFSPIPSKCLLYEEKRNIDMTNSQGIFVIPIGDGKGTRTGSDPNLRIEQIFANNSVTIPNLNCNTVGAYTPQPLDQRLMEVSYDDQSGYGWDDLPPMDLNYVPLAVSAHDAQNLAGTPAQSVMRVHSGDPSAPFNATPLTPSGFAELLALINGSSAQYEKVNYLRGSSVPVLSNGQVLGWDSGGWKAITPMTAYTETDPTVKAFAKSDLPTCGINSFLRTNATGDFDCVAVSGATGGTVTGVTAGTGLQIGASPGGTITSTGTLNVDVGSGPGQIVQLDNNAKLPALDGSQLTGVVAVSAATASALSNSASINISGDITTSGSFSASQMSTAGDVISNGRIHGGTMLTSKGLYLYDDKASPNTGSIGLKSPADVPTNYILTLPDAQGASGQVLGMSSTTGQLTWINPSSGSVTAVTAKVPLISSGGATSEISLPAASSSQSGYLTSSDWNVFKNKMDSTILFAGDVSGSANTMSVDRIKGVPVTPTAYANGQVLRYNSGSWVNSVIDAATDITGVLALSKGGTGGTTATAARANLELKSAALVDTGNSAGNVPVLGFGGLVANKMCTSDGTASGVICINDIPNGTQWITNGSNISYSSGNVGIGTTNPSSLLTVNGLIESSSGGIKFPDGTVQTTAASSGTGGVNGLGSWQTFTFNTVHQASSDGMVVAIMHGTSQAGIQGFTDSSNPPTTVRLNTYSWATSGGSASLTMPVKAGDYWKVTTAYSAANTSVYWVPLSAGGNSMWQASSGNLYYNTGNLGLGTANPGAKLEVAGQVKITGGSPGSGKVLTSNASGLATWEFPAAVTADNITGTLPIAKGGTNSVTDLANKRIMISNAGSIVESSAISPHRVLISNSDGLPAGSTVTSTELSYLSGVTSSIQAQLAGMSLSTGWANHSVMGVDGSGGLKAIPGSASGSILSWTSAGPQWTVARFPASTSANQLLYSSANNVVGGITTAANAVLKTDASGVPSWSVISNDNFQQYALLAGRAGGQNLSGGIAANENLVLDSTSDSSKGNIILAPSGGKVGIGTATPNGKLTVAGIIETTSGGIKFPDGSIQGTAAGSGPFRTAEARSNTVQSIPPITWRIVNNLVGQFDTGGFFSSSTPDRFTIPVGVNFVRVTGFMGWASNAIGPRYIQIFRNGASIFHGSGGSPFIASSDGNSDSLGRAQVTSPPIPVQAGDYIQIAVYQSSGGALNLIDAGLSIEAMNGNTTSSAGSGSADYIPLWADSTTLGSSPIAVKNGRVGVGTATPTALLDVEGEVKFGNTSAPCTASSEGQQRYNSNTKQMEFCNGISWKTVGAPSMAAETFSATGNVAGLIGTSGGVVGFTTKQSSSAAVFKNNGTAGIQILKAGKIHVTYTQDATCATDYSYSFIRLNGTTIIARNLAVASTKWSGLSTSGSYSVAAGDTLTFFLYCGSGAFSALDSGDWSIMSIFWMGQND